MCVCTIPVRRGAAAAGPDGYGGGAGVVTEAGRLTKDGDIEYRGKLLKQPNAFVSKASGRRR